jgi:membrane-associated phospholipid phosphatase
VTAAPHPRRRGPALSGSRLRELTFAVLILIYAGLTVGVLVFPSPVLDVDQWWLDQHLWGNHPQYHWFVYHYVMLGQRGPTTFVFLPLVVYLAWRRRTSAPVVMFLSSLLLLNVSVAVVKYAVGRIGPRDSDDVHQVFTSGTLFPSGHVSNTVVVYGVLAMLVPRFRKWIVAAVVFLCLTIGLGTIYLRTHWFSDVVGGWIAGALVLLMVPEFMPHAQRWTDRAIDALRERQRRRRARRALAGSAGGTGREPVAAGGPGPGNATPVG